MSEQTEKRKKWLEDRAEKLAQDVYKMIDSCMKDDTHDDCVCLFSATDWIKKEILMRLAQYEDTLRKREKEIAEKDASLAALRTERDRMREALEYVKKLLPQDQETLDHAIAERLHELSHYLLVDIPYAIDEALTPRQEERGK